MDPLQRQASLALSRHNRRLLAAGQNILEYQRDLRRRTWFQGIDDRAFWQGMIWEIEADEARWPI